MNMATSIMTLRNIRMAVCNKLKTANLPFIGEDVFCNRAEKAWPQEKAFLSVYVQQSSFDTQETSPEIYRVETDVVIDVVVQGAQELDGETLEIDDLFDVISSNVVDLLTSYPRQKWLVENQLASSEFTLRSFSDELFVNLSDNNENMLNDYLVSCVNSSFKIGHSGNNMQLHDLVIDFGIEKNEIERLKILYKYLLMLSGNKDEK